jgi:hypothetical protein
MRIALKSDFLDYYDHVFLTPRHPEVDWTWERMSRNGISRRQALRALETQGFRVPQHGLVKDLVPNLVSQLNIPGAEKILSLVVYVDEHAHAGEGKVLLEAREALERFPDSFACQYLPVFPHGRGTSFRWLRIGGKQSWLRYDSMDDWRSNCGEVRIGLAGIIEEPFFDSLLWRLGPMVAVDFLPIGERLYAIDLNTAPGLRGTGIEKQFSATQIYEAVSEYVEYARAHWGRSWGVKLLLDADKYPEEKNGTSARVSRFSPSY